MTDQPSVAVLALEERGLLSERRSGKKSVFCTACDFEGK